MKVYVYFNLHKKLFSVKALEGASKGKVIGHYDRLTLAEVTPKVSIAGRERVLRERQKNVHAGLVGTLTDFVSVKGRVVSYNPYKGVDFFYTDNQQSFTSASTVSFTVSNKLHTVTAI